MIGTLLNEEGTMFLYVHEYNTMVIKLFVGLGVMVFNATFTNISVILLDYFFNRTMDHILM